MRNDTQAKYNVWHDVHAIDEGAGTPWHTLLKKHLHLERDVQGKAILEIGCGRGGFSCWLAQQSARTSRHVAADLSEVAIRKARAHAEENRLEHVEWEVADIQRLSYGSQMFDTIFSLETVEHVSDPVAAIRELIRVLRPDGTLFLTVPNYLGTFGLYRCYLRLCGRTFTEEGQPINHALILPQVLRWLRQEGMVIERVDAEGHYLLLPVLGAMRLPFLDSFRPLLKWFALHSFIRARKASS